MTTAAEHRPSPQLPRRRVMQGVALAAALASSGCAVLRPPQLYLMPSAPVTAERVEGLSDRLIALSRIALPTYAADNRIARLVTGPDGETTVVQSGTVVWADDPERAFTGTLAAALEARTGAAVLAEPWPVESAPSLKIDVVASRFVGSEGGQLRLTGEIRVIDVPRDGLAVLRAFDIEVAVPGPGISGLADAHAIALGRLADEIASALSDRYAG